MDAALASMFLYLLFPVINERQAVFADEINQSANPERLAELEEYLTAYNVAPATPLLDAAAAESLPGDAADEMSGGPSAVASILLSDSLGRLKLFQYKDELLSVNETADGGFSDVVVNDEEFTRTKYDSSYRMIERIVWKRGDTAADSVMKSKTVWTYDDESAEPEQESSGTFPVFCGIEDFETGKYTAVFYDDASRPKETQEYELRDSDDGSEGVSGSDDKQETSPTAAERVLSKQTLYSYDSDGRILSDEEIYYDSGSTERTVTYEKRTLYEYTGKSKYANTSLYENGKLRALTEYDTDNDYTETIYFSDTAYVRTRYENGVRTSATIYNGQNE